MRVFTPLLLRFGPLLTLAAASPALADPVPYPAMSGPLSANANPTKLDAGPLGNIYVTGALTGLAQYQDHAVPGDHETLADLSNGQAFVQKTDGPVQFFIQAGVYSLPDLGYPYVKATDTTKNLYGVVPQAFIKIAPSSDFSILAGKLPTLIGAEYTFSFENMNVERGLLWNQESAVSRGVQANYAHGPVSASVSLNDGFYSKRFNWISASLGYTLDKENSVTVVGGGNVSHTSYSSAATPLLQNNGEIYNLIFTHTSGPWMVQPYLQYTRVHAEPAVGIPLGASTYGGALLVKYSVSKTFSLAGRAEYIAQSGSPGGTTPSLLYGPGSSAWSLTFTPTYQKGIFFVRGEASHIGVSDLTPGYGFGSSLNRKSQTRLLVEGGFLF
jgi:Putative beta-barrel porin-2, OmpL-like. bbp2